MTQSGIDWLRRSIKEGNKDIRNRKFHTILTIECMNGGKSYRRCEYPFFTERLFFECCGMRLRASPANREYKEKVRAKKKLIAAVL